MLAIARIKTADVPFQKMDMRQLEFADHTFDGVLAAYSIIHIPTPELPGVLAEIARILKPGGHALFITQQGTGEQTCAEVMSSTVIFTLAHTPHRQ